VSPPDLLLIGRCGRAHGVRGEVKVYPVTDDPARFEQLKEVYVGHAPATARPFRVEGVRYQFPKGKTVVLLALADVGGREGAETLTNASVYASTADLPALADNELFVHDLIGLAVVPVDDAGAPAGPALGEVRDVLEGGAQDLLVVARAGHPDVLLPDVPEFVIEIDRAGGRMLVRPPEGLFERE
jgi:16S rRNA processing protein RimM